MRNPYNSQNKHKKPPKTKSGLRGVIYHSRNPIKPWKAYIRKNGQYKTIGYFQTKYDAARAYNLEAVRKWGSNTYLNPI